MTYAISCRTREASAQTDLAAAQAMQQAKADLFVQFNRPKTKPARRA